MSRARDLADLGGSADAGGLTGRNLIINGAMQVAQRGTSVSVSNNAGYKTVDRWNYTYGDNTAGEYSTWTMSQDTDAPEGFSSSTKFICTTAASAPSSITSTVLQQFIEGQNLQHLKYGTANANKITASFWVKSNNTGDIGVSLRQPGNTRLYVESVSINSVNTWEYKTVTFNGDTSNSLANDNTSELGIRFAFEYNTGRIGGSASWEAGGTPDGQSYLAPTGVSARTSTADDTFYITGVQLEVGQTATPFEHRSYGDELARCQRYYQTFRVGSTFYASGTQTWRWVHQYFNRMRAIPTATITNVNGTSTINTQTITSVETQFTSSGAGTNVLRDDVFMDAEL